MANNSRGQGFERRSEAICLVAIETALLFAPGSVDIAVASWFCPDVYDHWPLTRHVPWPPLYRAATWITASRAAAGGGPP